MLILFAKNINNINTPLGHFAVNSWFLRLADLDKKVLLFNLLKKLKLVSKNKTNIYLYKKSYVIRN